MNKNRRIILDTETTGLDFIIKDRIIEIGVVELIDEDKIQEKKQFYINPGISVNPESTKIHGITDEMLKDKPKFVDIADELLDFIKDSPIIAHNAEFDRYFLNLELYLINKEVFPKNRFIDSLILAKQLYKGEKNSLDDLCIRFNIDNSNRNRHHGALIDAEILAKVYSELCKIINNYSDENLKRYISTKSKESLNIEQNFPYRKYNIKEDELQEHINFLKKIKNPIW